MKRFGRFGVLLTVEGLAVFFLLWLVEPHKPVTAALKAVLVVGVALVILVLAALVVASARRYNGKEFR